MEFMAQGPLPKGTFQIAGMTTYTTTTPYRSAQSHNKWEKTFERQEEKNEDKATTADHATSDRDWSELNWHGLNWGGNWSDYQGDDEEEEHEIMHDGSDEHNTSDNQESLRAAGQKRSASASCFPDNYLGVLGDDMDQIDTSARPPLRPAQTGFLNS